MTRDTPQDSSALLHGFSGAAILADADNRILDASAAARALLPDLDLGKLPGLDALLAAPRNAGGIAETGVTLGTGADQLVFEATAVPMDGDRVLIFLKDRTLDTNLQAALVDSRQRFKDLVEASGDFAFEIGPDRSFQFVAPGSFLGYGADDFIGTAPGAFVLEDLKDNETDPDRPFLGARPDQTEDVWFRAADGTAACLSVSSHPLLDSDGAWLGARGMCRDVTVERERDSDLADAYNRERLFNRIIAAIRDEVEPVRMLQAAASTVARAIGATGCCLYRRDPEGTLSLVARHGPYPPEPIVTPPISLPPVKDIRETETGSYRVHAISTAYQQVVNGVALLWSDGDKPALSASDRVLIRDVVQSLGIVFEQMASHEHIVRLSRTDGLTGLLNRRAFFEEDIPRRITRLSRAGSEAALLYLDLDNFKAVNDTRGHQAGDEVLLILRDLMIDHSRPGDALARLGGDEFALWMDGMTEETARNRARELLTDCEARFRPLSGDDQHPLGVSIGVALFNSETEENLERFIGRADEAMYKAKHGGKGRIVVAHEPGAPPAP